MRRLLFVLLALGVLGAAAGGVATATNTPPTGKLVVENFCPRGEEAEGFNNVNGEPLDPDVPPPLGSIFTGVCDVTKIAGKPATDSTLSFSALVTDTRREGFGFAILSAVLATPQGDITIQGGAREALSDEDETYAVTGGTGRYAGARGTVLDAIVEESEEGILFRDTFTFIR